MNTNQIRKFASEARILLLKGVSNSLRTFFSDSGEPIIVPKPVQGGCAFGAQTKDEAFLRRWQSLQHQITLHGFRWVVEQVAYTWFNRLVAINILAKNNLAEPMLQFANPALRVPYIVEQARAGHFPEMSAADIATLRELLNDDAKTFEQFSLLIGCYCTANPIIRRCFGCVDDHSLLLLPSNILSEGEIVDMLNRSDLITDDEYRSPELIGWLYQFYISERKDEVFAKKGKFEADEIPAATQIFTPNWIVKYMVQNSLGRIYLDNEPDSGLKERMQYLVGDAVSHCTNNNDSTKMCDETSQLLGGAVSHCTDTNDSSKMCDETSHLLVGAVSHCTNNKYCSKSCGETPHLLNFVNKKKYIYITGNKLPHWNQRDCVQFVTFRLADSLPQVKLQEYKSIKDKWLEAHPKPWDLATQAEYDSTIGAEIDKWLDAGYGNCILKDEKIRKIVEEAILHFNGEKYFLHAYVIMPNHVHVLLTPIEGNLVQSIVGSWKKFSAHEINYTLGRSGSVWERECFDRMIRSNDDFETKLNYIKNNPQGLSSSSYTLNVGGAVSHCTNTNDCSKLCDETSQLLVGAVSHCTDTNDCSKSCDETSQLLVGAVSHCTNTNDSTKMCDETSHLLTSSCGETSHLLFTDVRELTCADLACGSGHILNECFDLLYDIYIEQGYSRRDAVENIFSHNLIGVDIDTRAKQLATFALLLKACRRDASFADAHAMPRVLDMPEPYRSDSDLRDTLHHFFLGGTPKQIDETAEAIALFDYAEDLGSIMRFNISPGTREAIVRRLAEYRASDIHTFDNLFPYFDVILALTDRYAALVMNPPYMGSGNMNATLSKYVKDNYEEGKADLFSVFMLLAIDRLLPNGKYGMINMQSWMFLSSFEKLRTRLLTENRIDNMLHLGPRTFDELSGEVVQNTAFVITNCEGKDATGAYYRLIDGKNCGDKERMFLEVREHDGNRIYYPNVSQQDFEKIPGCPIGYWVSESFKKAFESINVDSFSNSSPGIRTGKDSIFIRDWYEVSALDIKFDATDKIALYSSKWFPITRGGEKRKWYGNLFYVIFGENSFEKVMNECPDYRLREDSYYFKKGITWTMICS
ncbi:MAG: Eco57I restriction-modification methylase domain-containing protein, partial [Muribaculaceae bacterium]